MNFKEIVEEYQSYYSPKIKEFGASYKGVDWGSEESQEISFEQIIKIFEVGKTKEEQFSVLDYGCGYGALLEYFHKKNIVCEYSGYDVLEEMLNQAKKTYADLKANWISKLNTEDKFDYVLASGVFTLKMKWDNKSFEQYFFEKLNELNSISKKGFAFNCLTTYSDRHLMRDYLYYADPLKVFDYCKKNFSRHVSLIHDYPKYEFTIIVRK